MSQSEGKLPTEPLLETAPVPDAVPAAHPAPAPALPDPARALARVQELAFDAVSLWQEEDFVGVLERLKSLAGAVSEAQLTLEALIPSTSESTDPGDDRAEQASAKASSNGQPDAGAEGAAEGGTGAGPDGSPGELAEAALATTAAVSTIGGLSTADFQVVLPPYRHPFVLVMEGLGDIQRAQTLARILEVDVATARLHCLGRVPRALIRGPQREPLVAKAAAIRAEMGVMAAVVARDELLALHPPLACVAGAVGSATGWRMQCVAWPGWLEPPVLEQLDAAMWIPLTRIHLAVPGEVVSRRFREEAHKQKLTRFREGRHDLGERRVQVLDLYGDSSQDGTGAGQPHALRLMVGMTDFSGLPGSESGSGLRSIRGLEELLKLHFPEVRIEARHTAQPGEHVRPSPDPEQPIQQVTGWPQWDEHTRLCWWLTSLRRTEQRTARA